SKIIAWLKENGYAPNDLGTDSEERCDAFDYAKKMVQEFTSNPNQFGILICGSGQAMAMTANRYKAIRAALCTDVNMAREAREHGDANILVLGADIISESTAMECVEMFLKTQALGGRYAERRNRLTELGGL